MLLRPAPLVAAALLAGSGLAAVAGPAISRSDVCGGCHRDIFRMWRASAHARALEDPVFLEALRVTEAGEGPAVSRVCLSCHAPAAELAGDAALERKTTWDGVSCDVCHSIKAVDTTSGSARMVLDVGRVKRGPIADAESTGHEVAHSPLHGQALVCAPCHEYANGEGVAIMTTYSEWQQSTAAQAGTSCQACHMGRTRADLVDPRVQRSPTAEVNLHEVPGGHSLALLQRALGVTVAPRREAETLVIEVQLTNHGAGHAVPTGMPGRRVILEVKGRTSAGGTFEERRIYAKSFTTAAGDAIARDSGYFASGVRLAGDTRLGPDEERREVFRFPVSEAASASISVKLHYEHAPTGDDSDRTWITFFSEERAVPGAGRR